MRIAGPGSPIVSLIKQESDAELLQRARDGDEAAFTELYVRHKAVARRVATTYRRSDAEDLVNEAFEKVLGALHRGGGPTDAFRAYLLVTLRRLAVERNGHGMAEEPLDEVPEPVVAVIDGPELSAADRQMITAAFETLPDRWQAVLWYTAVEGRHPREIAGRLGLSANAVSALAYRAREQLRQAYLQAHLGRAPVGRCKSHRASLSAYVRGSLSSRDDATTRKHLERCSACREIADELSDVNRLLVRAVMPLFLLPTGGKLASVANAVEAAAHAGDAAASGRRAVWPWLKTSAPVAGGIAAAAGAILGLGSVSTLVWRDDPPQRVQASQGLRNTTTSTTPAASDPTTTPSCDPAEAGAAASTTTTTAAPARIDVPAVGVGVQLPSELDDAVSSDSSESAQPAPPCDDTAAPADAATASSDTTASTSTNSTDDAVVVEAAPLDVTLTLDLPEGVIVDIGAIPTNCNVAIDDGQVTCALTAPVTGTEVTADLGLELTEILEGDVATVTVQQGDQVIEVDTEEILGSLTDPLLGGLLTIPLPE